MGVIGHRILRQHRSVWSLIMLALVGVIFALGVVNLLVIVLRSLDTPPDVIPGQLQYLSTFDAYNEQWTVFQGQVKAEILDDELRITSDAPNEGAFSELSRAFRDFDLSVNVRWEKIAGEADQAGILFRYKDLSNYYMFKIRSDGAYRVEIMKDGQVEALSQWQISSRILTAPGAVNQLRVVGHAFIFQFSVNDTPLPLCLKGNDKRSTWNGLSSGQCISDGGRTREQIVENSFEFGQIALGAVAGDAGLVVAFDNVVILGPRPQ
ncbi:hypothetical protein ANRL4_04620 [Anaerolineae bacterium]|nr:hypothetical protein ANRL4_04620 [Anaerolineae bacterium]